MIIDRRRLHARGYQRVPSDVVVYPKRFCLSMPYRGQLPKALDEQPVGGHICVGEIKQNFPSVCGFNPYTPKAYQSLKSARHSQLPADNIADHEAFEKPACACGWKMASNVEAVSDFPQAHDSPSKTARTHPQLGKWDWPIQRLRSCLLISGSASRQNTMRC